MSHLLKLLRRDSGGAGGGQREAVRRNGPRTPPVSPDDGWPARDQCVGRASPRKRGALSVSGRRCECRADGQAARIQGPCNSRGGRGGDGAAARSRGGRPAALAKEHAVEDLKT